MPYTVRLDFYGPDHHLVIDHHLTTTWMLLSRRFTETQSWLSAAKSLAMLLLSVSMTNSMLTASLRNLSHDSMGALTRSCRM